MARTMWTNNNMDSQRVSTTCSSAPDQDGRVKKPYRKPQLEVWGDLRDLTLGPSPGVGESGQPGLFKP